MPILEMEDRKRSLDVESLNNPVVAKKRPHLDRSASSFASNGSPGIKQESSDALAEDDESTPAYKGLEAYRKEAIYRHMREAKRDLQRSQEKTQKLKDAIEAVSERSAAFNHFYDTLINDLQLLIKDDAFPPEHKSKLLQAIPFVSRKPELSAFSESQGERNASLKAVLSRIVSLGSTSSPEVEEIQARCHRLGEESASLRSKLTLAINDKEALLEELNETIDKLKKAEKKFDRSLSATVKATERPGEQAEEEAEKARIEAADAEKEAALQRKEQAEGQMQVDNGTNSNNGFNKAAISEELEDFKRLAQTRLDEIERFKSEMIATREESERFKRSMEESLDTRLLESSLYQDVHRHFEEAKRQRERIEALNERIEAENTDLRERRAEFEANAKAEANSQIDGLRNSLKVHEGDATRLRGDRDRLTSELAEIKQREASKYLQVDELKALVASKDKRIVTLRSEVRRLQLALAAKNGDAKIVERLKAGLEDGNAKKKEEEDVEMIEILQDRLKAAEESSLDLKRQLDARSSSTTEQDLINKVTSLQSELDSLSSILKSATSDELSSPEDVKARLVGQVKEIADLKRELANAQESTTALCDELDKMGEAYHQSQKVATERVVEVGRLEDKMLRLTTEKSKADNRYFGAMRSKDALEKEMKATLHNNEMKQKVIDASQEVERTFQQQSQKFEADLTHLRAVTKVQNATLLNLQGQLESNVKKMEFTTEASRRAEETSARRNTEYIEESQLRQQWQEKCDKLQRELDRCKKQLASSGSSRKKGGGGDDVQVEYLNSLLRCSACKDRYRDRIITRCLHTFCQECVDARIQTRQRKCPHCGLGFSTSDVQTLYLQ